MYLISKIHYTSYFIHYTLDYSYYGPTRGGLLIRRDLIYTKFSSPSLPAAHRSGWINEAHASSHWPLVLLSINKNISDCLFGQTHKLKGVGQSFSPLRMHFSYSFSSCFCSALSFAVRKYKAMEPKMKIDKNIIIDILLIFLKVFLFLNEKNKIENIIVNGRDSHTIIEL